MIAKIDSRRRRLTLLLGLPLMLSACAGISLADQVAALMKEGQQLYTAKKYDESLAKFKQVIVKDPKQWMAYIWMARSYIAKASWADAIDSAKKGFELSPKGPEAIAVLGEALFGGGLDALKNGRLAESIGRFVEYLKLEPRNASAWLNVGKAYLGQAQYRDALNAFVQGLAVGGGAERTELIRGLLDGGLQAFSRNDYRTSIDSLREYVKYDSKNLQAYLNLAKAYWESGERGNALEAVRKVLELNPRHEEALRLLLRR